MAIAVFGMRRIARVIGGIFPPAADWNASCCDCCNPMTMPSAAITNSSNGSSNPYDSAIGKLDNSIYYFVNHVDDSKPRRQLMFPDHTLESAPAEARRIMQATEQRMGPELATFKDAASSALPPRRTRAAAMHLAVVRREQARDRTREGLGWFAYLEMLSFMATLAVGLVYVWRKGALEFNL